MISSQQLLKKYHQEKKIQNKKSNNQNKKISFFKVVFIIRINQIKFWIGKLKIMYFFFTIYYKINMSSLEN